MESPEVQNAIANILKALTFSVIVLTIVVAFRILPEATRKAIITGLSEHDRRQSPNISPFQNHAPRPAEKFQNDLPTPPVLKASEHTDDGKHHLLLAATGSVATIKIPNILHSLSRHQNLAVRLILTESAAQFLQGQSAEQPALKSLLQIPNLEAIYLDKDEWLRPWTRIAPILHIELRRWADLMVIAPVSANALAKFALGMSDNLVYSVVRAWDTTGLIDAPRPGVALPYGEGRDRKGILLAPAMNTAMWEHPITREHVAKLEGEGWAVGKRGWVEVLRPVEKDLACGDTGSGAMREWKDIVSVVVERLNLDGGGQHPNAKVADDEYIDVKKSK